MKGISSALACVTLYIFPFPASADVLCDNVNTVLRDIPNRFTNLRAGFDFAKKRYIGSVALDQLGDCTTQFMDRVGHYRCHAIYANISDGDLKQRVGDITDRLKFCFEGRLAESRLDDNDRSFDLKGSDGQINIISERLSDGRSYIQMEIVFVESGI